MYRNTTPSPYWQSLRDAALGLCVGMSAHLIWDALLSSTKSGFTIFGWNQSGSLAWLALNLILGLGVPFGVIWAMDSPAFGKIKTNESRTTE